MLLYVLALEDECWYVGISYNPMKRARQHDEGKGAAWTRKHKPLLPIKEHITIEDLGNLPLSVCELKEDKVTEAMQKEYGLNKVRGGYTVTCRDMKTRPTRDDARWLYNQFKNRPGCKRFSTIPRRQPPRRHPRRRSIPRPPGVPSYPPT